MDQAGGSRPGSAGGCGFIIVLQDPMESAGKVVLRAERRPKGRQVST